MTSFVAVSPTGQLDAGLHSLAPESGDPPASCLPLDSPSDESTQFHQLNITRKIVDFYPQSERVGKGAPVHSNTQNDEIFPDLLIRYHYKFDVKVGYGFKSC